MIFKRCWQCNDSATFQVKRKRKRVRHNDTGIEINLNRTGNIRTKDRHTSHLSITHRHTNEFGIWSFTEWTWHRQHISKFLWYAWFCCYHFCTKPAMYFDTISNSAFTIWPYRSTPSYSYRPCCFGRAMSKIYCKYTLLVQKKCNSFPLSHNSRLQWLKNIHGDRRTIRMFCAKPTAIVVLIMFEVLKEKLATKKVCLRNKTHDSKPKQKYKCIAMLVICNRCNW